MTMKNDLVTLVVLVIMFTVCMGQDLQPTRNVSVNIDHFQSGTVKLYFDCPNVRFKSDVIKYYKIVGNERVLIKEKRGGFGIMLELRSIEDLTTYECWVSMPGEQVRKATLNVMDDRKIKSPKKFVYKTEETSYVVSSGGSAELSCGSTNMSDSVNWYKPPQYHIYSGKTYKIDDTKVFDYGTYYCTVNSPTASTINVKKVILVKRTPEKIERSIDEETKYVETLSVRSKNVRYQPHRGYKSNDVITWEQPPGTILLDFGKELYIQSLSEDQSLYYYRVNNNMDPEVNIVAKLTVHSKQSDNIGMYINAPLAYGAPLKVDCVPPSELENDIKVTWKKDGIVISNENTLAISNFDKSHFGKYSCEAVRGTIGLKTNYVNLNPEQKVESKIEMTPDPGSFYVYHIKDNKELHCEIETINNEWSMKSGDIMWTINDKIFDKNDPLFKGRIERLDRKSVSILIIKKMKFEDQGTYKCYQKLKTLAANLLMEQREVMIEIGPSSQHVVHNVNQVAEMHCRIDSGNVDSSSIIWKFIPENSNEEIDLPAEARVERPQISTSTSFVTIDNSLKKHEGTYVCQVGYKKVFAKLLVKVKPILTVSPKTITVKPGGIARFLCSLKDVEGRVIWRRQDREPLVTNKENRIGGSSTSVLEVHQVTRNDDGTIYECVFNEIVDFVTLYVQEECALHQRKCKNDTCIDENKFCDGKNDCGDNSDEDKQRCNECSPNSIHCDFLKDANPTKRCIIKHWKCDGIDDCGNNFDELNCSITNQDKCIGTHYLCNNDKLIPRSYWCDGESDCPSNEDEVDCNHPQVIEPPKQKSISIFTNSTLVLICQISGRPVPTISWRFNWGHLPENLNYNISTQISNCSFITSTLTINNINIDQSGIYSCEGIARRRVMAPDFFVTVSKGLVCTRPYFNHDAWYKDMCIKCYCSNVTDDCTSAQGYITNPNPIESGIVPSDATIVNYQTLEPNPLAREVVFANSELKMYHINKAHYKTLVANSDFYFGGTFNMAGSWFDTCKTLLLDKNILYDYLPLYSPQLIAIEELKRYGYPLSFKLVLSGESVDPITGPMLVLQGKSGTVYYCGNKFRLPAFASNDNYENIVKLTVWEQDNWYNSYRCTHAASREEFLSVLTDVRTILFKVKYFEGQTDFKMSKVSMQEAVETKEKHSWTSRIEQCNCPSGYSGMSCEVKSN